MLQKRAEEFGNIRLVHDFSEEQRFVSKVPAELGGGSFEHVHLGHKKLGTPDDLFGTDVAHVRLERMDNGHVWLRLYGTTKDLVIDISAPEQGVIHLEHQWEPKSE